MYSLMKQGLLVLLCVMTLSACKSQGFKPDDPNYAPVISHYAPPPPAKGGSLYKEGYGLALFEDRRAARVGDILTVILDERTSSSKKNETDITKENSLGFDAGTLFGRGVTKNGSDILGASIAQDREFAGSAETDQSNRLQGSITVTVSEILPNGLLVVRGEKWMTLTDGEEFIRLRGLVRPEDVSPNNSIASTKLADARIAYSGTGAFADANKQGWAAKFFNSQWWPF